MIRQKKICLIHHLVPEGEIKAAVFSSSSILYPSKIVYWQVYSFTGYNGIMIEH